jgi:hypothetical protein
MAKLPTDLKDAYCDNHLALGLGAGISLNSGVPNWHDLVKRVAEQPEVSSTRAVAEGLLTAGYDATVVGGYLRSLADSQDSFIEAVRRSLYERFDAQFSKRLDKPNHRAFARLVREKNPTLHAVGTLCGRYVERDNFEPNRKIRAVLNFNLDFLLQIYTRARFKKRVLRTVERASASASGRLINAYHPHGYLARGLEWKAGDRRKESGDRLVLTEHQYYDAVAASNAFANYTILFLLQTYHFLFIGLSMTDPNLRRTLHLTRAERMRELKAEGESDTCAEERSRRHWAVMQRNNDATINQAICVMLRELGVAPLWLDNWSELSPLLEVVRVDREGRASAPLVLTAFLKLWFPPQIRARWVAKIRITGWAIWTRRCMPSRTDTPSVQWHR